MLYFVFAGCIRKVIRSLRTTCVAFFLAEMKSALLLVCIAIALVAVSDFDAISESKARPSTIMVLKKWRDFTEPRIHAPGYKRRRHQEDQQAMLYSELPPGGPIILQSEVSFDANCRNLLVAVRHVWTRVVKHRFSTPFASMFRNNLHNVFVTRFTLA